MRKYAEIAGIYIYIYIYAVAAVPNSLCWATYEQGDHHWHNQGWESKITKK